MEEDVVKLINKAKMMDLIDEDGTKYNLTNSFPIIVYWLSSCLDKITSSTQIVPLPLRTMFKTTFSAI